MNATVNTIVTLITGKGVTGTWVDPVQEFNAAIPVQFDFFGTYSNYGSCVVHISLTM